MELSNTLCKPALELELINCGRNAAKNTAVFGLSNATMKPSRNIRRSGVCGSVSTDASLCGARIALKPRYMRYMAPVHLTATNAMDEMLKSAARPIDAPIALPRLPAAIPATEAMPNRRGRCKKHGGFWVEQRDNETVPEYSSKWGLWKRLNRRFTLWR